METPPFLFVTKTMFIGLFPQFGVDYELYLSKPDLTYWKTTPGALLPGGFSPKLLHDFQANISEDNN